MTLPTRRGRHHAGYNVASLLRKRQPRRATARPCQCAQCSPAAEARARQYAVAFLGGYLPPF
jgi:hypothetical protein